MKWHNYKSCVWTDQDPCQIYWNMEDKEAYVWKAIRDPQRNVVAQSIPFYLPKHWIFI